MHVLPTWQSRPIAGIRRADVRELIEGIEGEVLPNRVLSILKTIFRFALSRDWIEASPVEGIAKPNAETQRDRVLDMPELARVWSAAGLYGFPLGQFVQVLALTGQRGREVAGMRWSDVDMEAGTWALGAGDTKAGRGHLVPLAEPAQAILRSLPKLGAYVFTNDGEAPFRGFAKGKVRLDKFIAAKGDPMAPWTLHDLRRSAATHMIKLGVSMEIAGRVLNHARQGVTAKVYALHEYAPEKRHALDRWASEMMRAVGGERGGNVVSIRG